MSFRERRPLPSVLAVGVVLLLAGIVAATSHASVWAPAREGVADSLELLAIVAAACLLSFGGAWAWSRWGARHRATPFREMLPGVVVVAVMMSLVAISQVDLRTAVARPGAEATDRGPGRIGVRLRSDWRGPAVRRGGEERASETGGSVISDRERLARRLMLFVGVVGLALLVSLRRPRRRQGEVPAPEAADAGTRAEAHGAIVSAIDVMLADSDPRTAIIGAYARLLEELEPIGASRWAYEGPTEHLRRVLSTLAVSRAPLETLVRLFEIARFSEHALTARHRDRALRALREVGAELAVPSDSHPTPGQPAPARAP